MFFHVQQNKLTFRALGHIPLPSSCTEKQSVSPSLLGDEVIISGGMMIDDRTTPMLIIRDAERNCPAVTLSGSAASCWLCSPCHVISSCSTRGPKSEDNDEAKFRIGTELYSSLAVPERRHGARNAKHGTGATSFPNRAVLNH